MDMNAIIAKAEAKFAIINQAVKGDAVEFFYKGKIRHGILELKQRDYVKLYDTAKLAFRSFNVSAIEDFRVVAKN